MSDQTISVPTQHKPTHWWEAEDFDREAYDRLAQQIEHTVESQFFPTLTQDPSILELDNLDAECFTEDPWHTYAENCNIRENKPLEQAVQETGAAFMKKLDEVFKEEYEQKGKNTERHRQGRERFHTLTGSLILKHIPVFLDQHSELSRAYANVTRRGDFMVRVAGDFIDTLQKACQSTWSPADRWKDE